MDSVQHVKEVYIMFICVCFQLVFENAATIALSRGEHGTHQTHFGFTLALVRSSGFSWLG